MEGAVGMCKHTEPQVQPACAGTNYCKTQTPAYRILRTVFGILNFQSKSLSWRPATPGSAEAHVLGIRKTKSVN